MSKLSRFELQRNYARSKLDDIQKNYLTMLNSTVMIESEKLKHFEKFSREFQFISEWLKESNSLFYCKLNYDLFLSHMETLAEECKVIYFGIALLYLPELNRKHQRQCLIDFFSTYNIQIEFDFFDRINIKRKTLEDHPPKQTEIQD